MGLFYSLPKSVSETTQKMIVDAVKIADPEERKVKLQAATEAADKTAKSTPQQFNWGRFFMALAIGALLFVGSVWTAKNGLPDISKVLINCVPAYMTLIAGLIAGEAQKK